MIIDFGQLAYLLAENIHITRKLERRVTALSETSDAISAVVDELVAADGRISTRLAALQNAVDHAGDIDPAVQTALDSLKTETDKISGLVPTDTVTNGSGVTSPAAPTGADGSTDTTGSTATEPAGNVSTATPVTDPSQPIDTGATSTNTVTPVTDTDTPATTDAPAEVTPTDTTAAPAEPAAEPTAEPSTAS